MLVIRFLRVGKKNQPSFRIVITDKRRAAKGRRFTEEVGFWNPLTKEKGLKKDRIAYWISKGAKPSASVYNLLVREKVVKGEKIPVHKKKKEKAGAKPQEAPVAAATEKPAEKEKPAIPPAVPVPAKEAEETKKTEEKKEADAPKTPKAIKTENPPQPPQQAEPPKPEKK